MTDDALMVLECLFSTLWALFTSWYIPGTDVTPAEFFMFLGFAGLSITFLFRMLGITPDTSVFSASPPPPPDMLNTPRLNAPGRNRGVWGWGPGRSWKHRD